MTSQWKNLSIESLWSSLVREGSRPVHRRVSGDHPLDLYAEVRGDDEVGLLALCTSSPPLPPDYESVSVEIARRGDGRWSLTLSLRRPDLRVLFATLCDDIIAATATAGVSTDTCGAYVLARLARWHRLLDIGRSQGLSADEQKGLLGELIVLRIAVSVYGPATAVESWNGPLDAAQDFTFPDLAVEVKAIHPGARSFRVTSIDQLDVASTHLHVVVMEISVAGANTDGQLTLASLVSEVRTACEADPSATAVFDVRLTATGYDEAAAYAGTMWCVAPQRRFMVTEQFPRLVRSRLPHGIVEARYDVLLADCLPFETTPFGTP